MRTWYGSLPAGWRTQRVKHIFREVTDLSTKGDETLLSVSEYFGVKPRAEVVSEGDFLSRAESFVGYKRVKTNDLAMNIMLAWKTGLGFTAQEGIISPAYSVFRLTEAAYNPWYFNYLLRSRPAVDEFHRWSYGIMDSRLRLYPNVFLSLRVPVPPPQAQNAIVRHLDVETARIDALIDRKRRFIDLLLEKRTALITHAVTRGLNPNAEMKDSGIEWVGSIPAHWTATRIKNVARLHTGHTPDKKIASYWDSGTIPWVSLADSGFIRHNRYVGETSYYTTPEGIANSSAVVLPSRSVILSRDATVGLCAITTTELAVSQHFMAWVCGGSVADEYLLYVLDAMKQELERLSMGSTIPTIGLPHIKNLAMPLPPLAEQGAVVAFLAEQTAMTDSVVQETHKSIHLLREYRTALISAAVTGQIDIPGTKTTEEVA